MKLYNQSWTFEAWIYPTHIPTIGDNPIVAQCDVGISEKCFIILIRGQKLLFGHFNDDASGTKNLTAARWHHVGFTFNCDTRNISIYLDGILDVSKQLNLCFQGVNQSLTVGVVRAWSAYFDGLIDELYYTNRTKTAEEILRDATLVAHFSFDDNSTYDQGPLRINGFARGKHHFHLGTCGSSSGDTECRAIVPQSAGLGPLRHVQSSLFIRHLDPTESSAASDCRLLPQRHWTVLVGLFPSSKSWLRVNWSPIHGTEVRSASRAQWFQRIAGPTQRSPIASRMDFSSM